VGEESGDRGSTLRAAGGVLLAIGALVVFIRRSEHHAWSDFELLLTVAVPAAGLFALALAGHSRFAGRPPDPSRSVLLVTSVLLSIVALFQLLQWTSASARHLLYDAAVLVVTAALGILGARRAGAPYAILLSGLALLGAWMLVWLKIISHPSPDTVRVLLLAGGALLLLAAAALELLDRIGAREIATAGGIGAVAAGTLGIFVGLFGVAIGAIGNGLIRSSSSSTSSGQPQEPHVFHGGSHIAGGQTTGWNIYLLIVSLVLVWLGARSRARGLGYVGAVGLLGFLISVGAELTRLEAGHDTSSSLLGWPLVLVLLGLACLLAPMLRRRAV
jgi:hypothetical protein